jgi:hypothetical protein
MLLGRNPIPTDDLSALKLDIASARAAVAARQVTVSEDPRVAFDDEGRLNEVSARPEIQASFSPHNWQAVMVDLRRVQTFQKLVNLTSRGVEVNDFDNSVDSLFEFCLPTTQPTIPGGAFTDPDGKGFTISSVNPNLRIAGGQVGEAMVSPGPGRPAVKMQAITLLVYMGTSYLQVVRYRDRYFLRDGYHRAARLLRQSVFIAPCIFFEAKTFEEISIPVGGFTYEALFSERPPRLTDFWDDSVTREIDQIATRKVVRIRGEEFVVPR